MVGKNVRAHIINSIEVKQRPKTKSIVSQMSNSCLKIAEERNRTVEKTANKY